jgi:hypothetical protein
MVGPFVSRIAGRPLRARLLVSMLIFCLATIVAGVRPAAAGYEWCSVDPVFSFQRNGSKHVRVMDVQVMVPVTALPLADPARLRVQTPRDVVAKDVTVSIKHVFELETKIVQEVMLSSVSNYPVKFSLSVPQGTKRFPVRLVITDTTTGAIKIVEGVAGQPVHTSVQVVE